MQAAGHDMPYPQALELFTELQTSSSTIARKAIAAGASSVRELQSAMQAAGHGVSHRHAQQLYAGCKRRRLTTKQPPEEALAIQMLAVAGVPGIKRLRLNLAEQGASYPSAHAVGKLLYKCFPRLPMYYAFCYFMRHGPEISDATLTEKLRAAGYGDVTVRQLSQMRSCRTRAVSEELGALYVDQPRQGAKALQRQLQDYDVSCEEVQALLSSVKIFLKIAPLSSIFRLVKKWTIRVPPHRSNNNHITMRPGRWHPYRPFFDQSKNGR